jgi:hypothetical protein
MDMRRQMNVFKKLTTYRYTDGDNRDKAGMARQKAENVIKLLNDEQLLGRCPSYCVCVCVCGWVCV